MQTRDLRTEIPSWDMMMMIQCQSSKTGAKVNVCSLLSYSHIFHLSHNELNDPHVIHFLRLVIHIHCEKSTVLLDSRVSFPSIHLRCFSTLLYELPTTRLNLTMLQEQYRYVCQEPCKHEQACWNDEQRHKSVMRQPSMFPFLLMCSLSQFCLLVLFLFLCRYTSKMMYRKFLRTFISTHNNIIHLHSCRSIR